MKTKNQQNLMDLKTLPPQIWDRSKITILGSPISLQSKSNKCNPNWKTSPSIRINGIANEVIQANMVKKQTN